MKVAVYQCTSPSGDVETAFEKTRTALDWAAAANADICILPELMLPGYNQPDAIQRLAQAQGGPWEQKLALLAQKAGCGLILGWAERDGGDLFNAASYFDKSGVKQAHYRKHHLFEAQEKALFTPSAENCVFEFAGQTCAILICFDIEFPERARELMKLGVTTIFVPTANPREFQNVSDIIVRSRALENEMTIVYVNYCGDEGGLTYAGATIIATQDGNAALRLGETEGFGIVTLG